MRIITVNRDQISDNVNASTLFRGETPRYGYGAGSATSLPSQTPLQPYLTPMRDFGATPIHDGMRTPMCDRAWNPYTPMSPPRDNWEEGNPASWGTSPQYQPGNPPSRTYEVPSPGSGTANTASGNYSEAGTPRDSSPAYANALSPYLPSTPSGQPPMTTNSAYLPGTHGGQPSTPGGGGLDMMSPIVGGHTEGPWILPNILVNVRKIGEDGSLGVVKELLPDGSCRIALGLSSNGESVTAFPGEIEAMVPRKSDKIKIMGRAYRGATGKLIGIDGTDGIVKLDDTLDVKILDMVILAKLA